MAAAALAAFELLLLVMIFLAFLGKPLLGGGDRPLAPMAKAEPAASSAPATSKKAQTKAKSKAKPATEPRLVREETSVIVLNGNGAAGAASEKADLVRTRGYMIAGTANAPRTDFARSVVMYRPGYRPEAQRFARDFGIARVAPLDGLRPADLQGAHVALIVGAA